MQPNTDALTEPYWNPSGNTVSIHGRRAFGERLAKRLRELGWTQTDLARKVGHRPTAVAAWRYGNSLPREEDMRRIACVLGMTLKELAPPIDRENAFSRTLLDGSPG